LEIYQKEYTYDERTPELSTPRVMSTTPYTNRLWAFPKDHDFKTRSHS
jgi:hypothetical protein